MGLRRTHSPGRAHEHVNQMALLDELLYDKSNLICLLIFMFLAALTALYLHRIGGSFIHDSSFRAIDAAIARSSKSMHTAHM